MICKHGSYQPIVTGSLELNGKNLITGTDSTGLDGVIIFTLMKIKSNFFVSYN